VADHKNNLVPWALNLPGLLLFVSLLLVPMLMTIVLSFNVYDMDTGAVPDKYTIAHYLKVLGDSYYYEIFFRTYWIALCVALICVVVGVPEAYIISRMRSPWRSIMLLVVLAPLLVSVVVRAFGWSLLLNNTGLVNSLLTSIGVGPARIIYTETAVIIALVHVMLPFMVIPVWTSLQKLDPAVENAALSLNASHFTTLTRVVFPQVIPGILSGSIIVFGLTASAFAIPGLLGGRRIKMAATLVFDLYKNDLNWPLGATIAIVLLAVNLAIILTYNRYFESRYRKILG
jgi:putative spermidine/putrescine transport system permease protein